MSSMMTIAEAIEKCKSSVSRVPRDILIISIIIMASLLSYGLGFMAGGDAAHQLPAVSIEQGVGN